MPLGLLNSDFIKDLRNSILGRNLNPTTEATLGGVSSLNANRGLPAETSLSQGNYVPINQTNVSSLGYYYLKNLTIKNIYAPYNFQQIELNDTSVNSGNIGLYTEVARTQSSNNGLFDLKQYVLNSPNLTTYNDTPLGVIGAQQLKYSLEANIAQNTIKNTLGRVNLNVFSLLNGEEFLIRNYQITEVPNTGLGFFVNLAQKYSGFEFPKSYIPSDAFGFFDSLFDGKVIYGDCNLEDLYIKDQDRMDGKYRNDTLLRYTGRGNRVQLFNMLGINKYRPNYDDPNGPDTGLNRIFGFLQQRKNNNEASYNTLEDTRRSSGVLPVMGKQNIASPYYPENKGKEGAFVEDDARSVLGPNGLPKITWTNKDVPTGYKRFMFSIENLAWIGNTDGLPECEIGNGDLNSDDNRPGRIMWFPPYALEFDENVSVQWDRTNFIGRGEPIFTYNNTIRSGTIRFKVVVDHPSILNKLRDNGSYSNSDMLKFFKGCKTTNDYVKTALNYLQKQKDTTTEETINTVENQIIEVANKSYEKQVNETTSAGGTKNINAKIYFPNASASVDTTYENLTGFNLNGSGDGFMNPTTITSLQDLNADEVQKVDIVISVAATSRGTQQENESLLQQRYNNASSWIRSTIAATGVREINITQGSSIVVPNTTTSDPNSYTEVSNRFADIRVTVTLRDLTTTGQTTVETTVYTDKYVQDKIQTIVTKVFQPVYRECDYFYYLEKNTPFIYSSLKEKLKYFSPGFHSTTPEGLNSRLTFLHQCTRQGPAIDPSVSKSNLAFGRPPILILRIGDFFHTKMVIESMSITYDEGVLWDLNPEGIGVQPRIASVSLTVSYLGGHSLMSPIRELQNALGYNFYANTEVFQHAPRQISESFSTKSKESTTNEVPSLRRPTQRIVEEPTAAPPAQQPFIGPPTNPYTFNNYVDSPIPQNSFNNLGNYGELNYA